MPKSKKEVHDLYSKKIANKRISRRRAGLENAKAKLEDGIENVPATVNNYTVNKPLFGPHKIKKKSVEVKQRKISPMEGKPVVNAKVATKKNFIHKPAVKLPMDPATGSLEGIVTKQTKKKTKRSKNVDSKTKE